MSMRSGMIVYLYLNACLCNESPNPVVILKKCKIQQTKTDSHSRMADIDPKTLPGTNKGSCSRMAVTFNPDWLNMYFAARISV